VDLALVREAGLDHAVAGGVPARFEDLARLERDRAILSVTATLRVPWK
jgi:hypothetical protein